MGVREVLGISEQDYLELLEYSEGNCWICGNPESVPNRRLAIDHDHEIGAVRGLLCTRCNRRLGASRSAEWHRRASEYLEAAMSAFGDACRKCGKSAPKFLVETNGEYSTFEHRCCRHHWKVGYRTKGIPSKWLIDGIALPKFPPMGREFWGKYV